MKTLVINLNLLIDWFFEGREEGREDGREREKTICCSTYFCIHWLLLVSALTWDWTHNLGILGWCSNKQNCPARAKLMCFYPRFKNSGAGQSRHGKALHSVKDPGSLYFIGHLIWIVFTQKVNPGSKIISENPARIFIHWMARRRKKQDVHSPFSKDPQVRTYMAISGFMKKWDIMHLSWLVVDPANNRVPLTEKEEKD